MNASFHRSFGIASTVVVLVAIIWGFIIIGSPGNERLRKFDEQRVNDLRTISGEILNIVRDWRGYPAGQPDTLERELPPTLDEVVRLARYTRPNIVDPQTDEEYGYTVTGETTYQLCATFSFPRTQQYDVFWDHPAGAHCYEFDALEPEGYRIPNTTKPLVETNAL